LLTDTRQLLCRIAASYPHVVRHATPGKAAPRTIDDSCPGARVPGSDFWDVAGNPHESSIDCVAWWQVAAGNSLVTYGPGGTVTRAQMATFIARLVNQSGGEFPDQPRDHFSDDDGSPHERSINQLAEVGVVGGVGGVGGGRYAPAAAVSRAQMATFLVRACDHRSGGELAASRDYFGDDDGTPHEDNINKAAEAGFTGGTAAGSYSPGLRVNRAQMASFLARVLDLVVEEAGATPPERSNRRLSGTGTDVITGSIPDDRMTIATIEHTGASNFIVWAVDDEGEKLDLLVNEIGDYSGTRSVNFGSARGLRGIDIQADGAWSMVIQPANWAHELTASGGDGRGEDIVDASRLAGAVVRLTHDGDSNFVIWVYDDDGERIDLLVNEIGEYAGTHRVPNGAAWFDVSADGNWTVTRQ
jgi:hypothetical protein